MKDKEKEPKDKEQAAELDPQWPQEAQDELQDFIESQGIYIRQ